jgi:5-methylcytosine-specific restriction endonuclease McrA
MNDKFYNSTAWRKLSKAFLCSKYYICERCGGPAEIAHHKIHLSVVSINDHGISLNPDLLEALCLHCHNTEHFCTGSVTAPGLVFDEDGELIKSVNAHLC